MDLFLFIIANIKFEFIRKVSDSSAIILLLLTRDERFIFASLVIPFSLHTNSTLLDSLNMSSS